MNSGLSFMKNFIVLFIVVSLLFSNFVFICGSTNKQTVNIIEQSANEYVSHKVPDNNDDLGVLDDPSISITYPAQGYLYLFKLKPIKRLFLSSIGAAVVVGQSMVVETETSAVHHVKFIAKRQFTGWQTTSWDYQTFDGLSMDMSLSSGIYRITAYGYDENDNELCVDSIKVFYIKKGIANFGVWVNTKYDNGMTLTSPVSIGLTEFGSMLNTGETRRFDVTTQSEDDTSIELRFIRTKIMNSTIKVIEANCNIDTACDTTRPYEVSVEVRFPFIMLDGGQPSESDNPYFSASIGYLASAEHGAASNKVNTTFYFGRESIDDPRIFRLSVKPSDIESGSILTFFTSYVTVDSSGNEMFKRKFFVDFEPATELTITSIPLEAKISYEFGQSSGVPTTISFRAEGGIFEDIVQKVHIDPLPSFISYDLTIIGVHEFIYESDRPYDVTYSLESVQNGEIVSFEVIDLPQSIHASWGLELGTLGDLSASGYAELDMSSDVEQIALYFLGNDYPFAKLENFPKKLRFDSSIDVLDGTGAIAIERKTDEVRDVGLTFKFDEVTVTKSFALKNNLMQMTWDINLADGTGLIDITRDSQSEITLSSSIVYQDWTFSKVLVLRNNHIQLSWDVDREQKTGSIVFSRDPAGGEPTLTFSIAHDTWVISNTLEFKNDYLELYWDLPAAGSPHTEFGLNTGGAEMFYTALSVFDNSVELLSIGFGIQTEDKFFVSCDYANGQISNFQWSGRLLSLSDVDISLNLIGQVFTIDADIDIGESGAVELQFNKPVSVTFVDSTSEQFKIHGNASFYANSKLMLSWVLNESGEFTVYTYGQPLGDQFSLEFGWDPAHVGNYKYGFKLIGEDFIQITRTIKWYSENGQLVRVWVLGDQPIPGDWSLQVLWNYQWYNVPWP